MKRILLLLAFTLLSACAALNTELPASFLGGPIPQSDTDRTIEVLPDTKWVNVTGGENIWFVIGDKGFGWTFDAMYGPSAFDLQRIAPPGMLDRSVTTYVAPDPRKGGDDSRE